MGTWSAEILGNDTSCDIHERVMAAYDGGAVELELADAAADLLEAVADVPKARNDAMLGLALALWEVGALDEELRAEVAALLASGEELELARELGATATFLAERAKQLATLAKRIATPKKKPRPRRPPPVELETPYRAGACLGVPVAGGGFVGVVVAQSSITAKKGSLGLALTTLETARPPTLADFLDARLLGCTWEVPYGRATRLATPEGKVARLWTLGVEYERATAREPFLRACEQAFHVAGHLAPFHRVLFGSTGLGLSLVDVAPADVGAALVSARGRSPTDVDLPPLAELAGRLRR